MNENKNETFKIYKITNTVNGKVYIGQTIRNLEDRFKCHTRQKNCRKLYNAIQKHGKENFTIELIEFCSNIKQLNDREIFWINTYKSNITGYNIELGGKNKITQQETKDKLSKSLKGRIFSDLHKRNISIGKTGNKNPHSFEHIQKLKNKKRTQEQKIKYSLCKLGNKNPSYGKPSPNRKSIKCIETNTVFNSITEASILMKIDVRHICNVLKKKRLHTHGFKFIYWNSQLNIPEQNQNV